MPLSIYYNAFLEQKARLQSIQALFVCVFGLFRPKKTGTKGYLFNDEQVTTKIQKTNFTVFFVIIDNDQSRHSREEAEKLLVRSFW